MNSLSYLVTISLLVSFTTAAETAAGDTCRVFVLKRADQGYEIDAVDLAPNETKVFPSNRATGIVDVILTVAPGGSGSIPKWSEERLLVARCSDGELAVTNKLTNGEDWARPARKIDDLARYDVRVSVTGADGVKRAFLIVENDRVFVEEVGPVVDMFGGKIPMSDGDHILCTDTYRHSLGLHVEGEAPLEYDRWPLVTVKLADGKEGVFIVDIGAGTTVVSRSFLPDDIEIEKAAMVQYSSSGKKMLKYTPGGATGAVDTILGHATPKELRIGDIVFENPTVDVMGEIPDIFGRPIAGILGMNLMRRCDVLSMSLKSEGKSTPSMRMGRSARPPDAQVLEVPFTFVSSHLTVDGRIEGAPVHFIMDTGSPDVVLDAFAAERIGVKMEKGSRPGRGLDGGSSEIRKGSRVELSIAARNFEAVQPQISALPCFRMLRTNKQNAGLLGNSFFSRFTRMELDFKQRVARFIN
ncbi:MAG: aspartyl protease family protein [Planctomycetota bacterium]|jgi:predicted aspartyl protease